MQEFIIIELGSQDANKTSVLSVSSVVLPDPNKPRIARITQISEFIIFELSRLAAPFHLCYLCRLWF